MNVLPILIALIPVLVQQAESLLHLGDSQKKDWVVGAVHSILTYVESKSPGSIKPIEVAVEPLIDALVEAAVSALP